MANCTLPSDKVNAICYTAHQPTVSMSCCWFDAVCVLVICTQAWYCNANVYVCYVQSAEDSLPGTRNVSTGLSWCACGWQQSLQNKYHNHCLKHVIIITVPV